MNDLIQAALDRLQWKVTIQQNTNNLFTIDSYAHRKEHVIRWPQDNPDNPARAIEYLHELVHAELAETVHPLFSGSVFVPGTDMNLLYNFQIAFQAANDWFVDGRLMTLCPEKEKAEILEHLNFVMPVIRYAKKYNPKVLYMVGFMIAQAQYWCNKDIPIKGTLRTTVKAFTDMDPQQPTLENLNTLLDKLLAPYDLMVQYGNQNDWTLIGRAQTGSADVVREERKRQ